MIQTDKAGQSWRQGNGNLPSYFGFAMEVRAHEPEMLADQPNPNTSPSMASCGSTGAGQRVRNGSAGQRSAGHNPATTIVASSHYGDVDPLPSRLYSTHV